MGVEKTIGFARQQIGFTLPNSDHQPFAGGVVSQHAGVRKTGLRFERGRHFIAKESGRRLDLIDFPINGNDTCMHGKFLFLNQ